MLENINFEFFYPKNARRITIRIKPYRKVRVSAPKWVKKADLELFLLSKYDWMQSKFEELERYRQQQSFEIKPNAKIKFLNQELILKVYTGKFKYREDSQYLHLWLPTNSEALLKKALSRWYKEKILPYLDEAVNRYTTRLGVKAKSIQVKSYKSRWGACSSKGELIFNWQIATFTEKQFCYVVAHEVCHLLEMNHSKKFYNWLSFLGFEKNEMRFEMKNLRNIL